MQTLFVVVDVRLFFSKQGVVEVLVYLTTNFIRGGLKYFEKVMIFFLEISFRIPRFLPIFVSRQTGTILFWRSIFLTHKARTLSISVTKRIRRLFLFYIFVIGKENTIEQSETR